jgi:hypothetical protein
VVDTRNDGLLDARGDGVAKGSGGELGNGDGVLVSSGLSDGVGETAEGLTSVTDEPGFASTAKKSLVEAPR